MKARLIRVDDQRWSQLLAVVPYDFYHLPTYCELAADEEGGDAVALLVSEHDRQLLLPLVARPIDGDGHDLTSPYGYPGPLVAPTRDAGFLEDAMATGAELLAAKGYVSLFVRMHPLLGPGAPAGIGTIVEHPPTVVVDLEQRDEEWWSRMRRSHRQQIRKALEAGHRAYIDTGPASLGRFKEIYHQTMQRLRAKDQYHFSETYFDRLRQILGPSLNVCVIEHEDHIWAAGLFVETHGIVQSHLSGDDGSHRTGGAKKLMYAHVREWAKARGDRWLHLGGGAPSPGLLSFKTGFSRDRRPFATLRVILRPDAYGRLVARMNPGADADDLNAYFPAYRLAH